MEDVYFEWSQESSYSYKKMTIDSVTENISIVLNIL